MTPGIFHKCKFVYKWRISGDGGNKIFDFLDYMLRPEAFEPNKHANEMEYVYSEFVPNEKSQAQNIKAERSLGAFTSTQDSLTPADIDKIRQLEAVSRSEGCPKYAGVISFDNAYLRQNNFIVGNQLNRQALIEAARKGINKMIDKSEKLDASNCYWVGSIHVNTGNVHIHYQLLEYHRLEDRRITYKNKGQDDIEQKAFNALKTEMTHFIDKSAAAANLTEFQRNVLAPHIKSEFASSIQKINALIDKLPDDLKNSGKQWWYAKQNDVTKNEIDSCIRSVISENQTLQIMFDTYLHKLDSTQAMFRNRYGQNSKWANYKETQLYGENKNGKDGFYSRVGNSFLNICREYYMTKDKNIQINNIPESKMYLSEKASDPVSEKLWTDTGINNISEKSDEYLPENEDEGFLESADILQDSYDEPQDTNMYLFENKKDDFEDAMPYDSLENSDIPDDLEMYLSSRNYDELYEPNAPDYSTDIFPQEPEAYLSENDKSDQAVERLRIDWSKNYKLALDYMYGNEQNKSAVIKKDPEKAFEILSIESKSGNILATYDIGKLYDSQMLKSNDCDTLSQQYYSKSFEDFHKLLSIVSMSDDKRDNWTKSYLNYRIGKMYEYGLGVTQDYSSAIEHYKLSENKYAYFALGNIYKYGSGVETDYAKAFDYYMRSLSSKGGMPFASYAVGQAYELGQGVEKDLTSAHNFYAEALTGLEKVFTKNHDDNISYKIGMMYLNGKGTDIDLECAEKYLLLSADSNNYKAQYMLGKLYQSDSKKDLQKAEKVLIKGAENAQDKTGLCEYSLGKLYLSQERYDKAVSYLERSAAKDNYYAAYTLGKLYQEQFNDNTQAEKYLLQAADHKDDTIGIAAYRLGKLYLAQEKSTDAAAYLQRSAAKDNYFAAYALGKLYQEQFNDNALAEKHLMHAAEHKDDVMGTAAYRLGKLYLSFQDKRKALQYFIKAADKDNVYGMYAAGKILLDSRKSTEVSKGIRYLSSAADKDFEPAIYTLGKYYSSFNNTKAKEYLKRSAFEYNDPNAQYILGKVYLSENKNEMAEKCFRQCALNGNNSGQLAYGLMLLRDGQKKAAYQWLRKSARSGNDIAKKIISGKKADIPFEFRLAGCMQAQRTLLHKSSSMLRNALKSEEAKTARLMREFEIEQEMAKAKEQYHSI